MISAATMFQFRALDANGAASSGIVEAPTADVAAAKLSDRGLLATRLSAVSLSSHKRRTIRARDLALGLRMLADLLDSGLGPSRALNAWEELAPPAWLPSIRAIRARVDEGGSLSAAMRSAPAEFPPLVLGLIQAGEAGGTLPVAVRRAAHVSEDAAAASAALRAALAYPAVLVVTGLASVTLMIGVVLPKFAGLLADAGQQLPASTRILLGLGTIARSLAAPVGVAIALAAIGARFWLQSPAARLKLAELRLRAPVVGPFQRCSAGAHFCGALAALIENGVPLVAALRHAADASGDAAMSVRVNAARQDVLHGDPLSRALERHAVVTATAVRLVRAGEQNGQLAPMLAHAGVLERTRAKALVTSAVRLIEPGLIVVLGGTIGFVAAALLQAVYSVRPGM